MSALQTPKHRATRSFLRTAGPIIVAVGIVFLVIALVDFFSAFSGDGEPNLFWCAFVGMPSLFVGLVMCMFGYAGSVARYMAAEHTPVATDTINDLAAGTQGAVKTVAKSVAEGIKEANRK